MKRWVVPIAIIAIMVPPAFFIFAPKLVEQSMNKIEGSGIWPVSEHAAALHRQLAIVDLHSDTLMWKRPLDEASDRGHVDLPRLEAGNVALQVFSSVTKTPKGQNYEANSDKTDNITLLTIAQAQPPRTWTSLLERSLFHAEKLRDAEAAAGGRLRIIRSQADLDRLFRDRAAGRRVTGALLSVEGAQDLEGRLSNIDTLYDAGFRMIGLAHFFDNELAGSMHGEAKSGLTPLGRQAVAAMERKGIIVDLAHSSHKTFADVMAIATRPVVVSHGGVKATCDTNRNLTDDELRLLARNGGMIGIGYWDAAVCAATPAATAKAIRHVRDLVGIQHVGLGSDFDGATTTGFDTAHIAAVTSALVDAGLSDNEIAMVMGGNAARLLGRGMVPNAALASPAPQG
ncbi:amidohydrolase family protein [Polymorphobacter fuscus]|uniref:Amidohydrolase family protein n=1 Tax=Sandarakinorhabdus fusca TaxID=1439888 RepID=A0A7C9GQY7_9SPHN|nr:amidohydrolase family protein [Polymorphobacter fuscus]MQT18113.1 amidohydrolase family protein [Polymorphobacter fuscus]